MYRLGFGIGMWNLLTSLLKIISSKFVITVSPKSSNATLIHRKISPKSVHPITAALKFLMDNHTPPNVMYSPLELYSISYFSASNAILGENNHLYSNLVRLLFRNRTRYQRALVRYHQRAWGCWRFYLLSMKRTDLWLKKCWSCLCTKSWWRCIISSEERFY